MGMRLVDLRFGPNKEGECYISLMPGSAGGLEANVNRWRTQMAQPAYTAEEFAKLPKKPFFNREATFVAFDGDFDRCFLFDGDGQFVPGEYVVGLLAEAFLAKEPGGKVVHDPRVIWNTLDVVARAGGRALVLFRLGDSWVARALSWDDAVKAPVRGGKVRLRLRDPAAPVAALAVSGVNPWPPESDNEAIAA
jgi:phosphomannomutase